MGYSRPEISASAGFLIVLTAAVMVVPLPWVLAWLAASAIHELGHILALRACGISWTTMRFCINGMRITTQKPTLKQEIVCSLAGPAAGLAVLLFARWVPRVAVCAVIQTACNLIPVYPLDGGRAFTGLTNMLMPPRIAGKTIQVFEWLILILLGAAVVWITIAFSLGVLPLVAYMGFLLKTGKIKISCKHRGERVQ